MIHIEPRKLTDQQLEALTPDQVTRDFPGLRTTVKKLIRAEGATYKEVAPVLGNILDQNLNAFCNLWRPAHPRLVVAGEWRMPLSGFKAWAGFGHVFDEALTAAILDAEALEKPQAPVPFRDYVRPAPPRHTQIQWQRAAGALFCEFAQCMSPVDTALLTNLGGGANASRARYRQAAFKIMESAFANRVAEPTHPMAAMQQRLFALFPEATTSGQKVMRERFPFAASRGLLPRAPR
jgi:hypothetical protein